MVDRDNGNYIVMSIIEQIWALFKATQQVQAEIRPDPMMEALREYGTKELTGPEHNPEVLKYFAECGFDTVKDDETSWCSAFMCWCHLKAGLSHTKSLAARSWLGWGERVTEPKLGDIVVFWRVEPRGWQGHVGFFVRKDEGRIWVLGGNQGNQVCIEDYSATQLLGYRR